MAQIQVVMTDLTAYKVAHRTLLDGQETFGRQQQASAAQLRRVNDELDHVVKATLQELARPLGRVMASVEHLRGFSGPVGDGLSEIERGHPQQLAIIESVGRYMQARRLRPRLRPVDLEPVLRDVLGGAAPLLAGQTCASRATRCPRYRATARPCTSFWRNSCRTP